MKIEKILRRVAFGTITFSRLAKKQEARLHWDDGRFEWYSRLHVAEYSSKESVQQPRRAANKLPLRRETREIISHISKNDDPGKIELLL